MKKRGATAQKMKRTGVILLLLVLYPAKAYGSTAQDIAAASGGFLHVKEGGLISALTNEKEFIPAFEHTVSDALRVCDAAEMIYYPFRYEGSNVVYQIPPDSVELLLTRQHFVEEWLSIHVPAIVPAGTDRTAAIRMIFDYIVSNYSYDYGAPDDFYSIHDSQGAYRIITTGQGICSGYSKLFRGMVEYLPFTAQGIVDYEAQEVFHIPVAIVNWTEGTEGHEWNAIQDPGDGLWYHYDLSETVMEPWGYERFHLSDLNIAGDGKHGRISEHIYEY